MTEHSDSNQSTALHFTQAEWDLAMQIVEEIDKHAYSPDDWDTNVAVDVTCNVLASNRAILAVEPHPKLLTGEDWDASAPAIQHAAYFALKSWVERNFSVRPAEPHWQPIETAPKDGSSILVGMGLWKRIDQVCWRDGSWSAIGGKVADGKYLNYEPTHWGALPAVPSHTGDGK